MNAGVRRLALAAAMGAISACATPAPEGALIADPYEDLNRDVYGFNKGFDQVLARPVARAYEIATPALVKHLAKNAVNHIRLPGVFANYLLQGDFGQASETFGRFVANTVLGAGGLLDPATDLGLPLEATDFGITLAEWGAEEGPYVMLPLFGPQTGRDALGSLVDFTLLNPFTFFTVGSGSGAAAVTAARVATPVVVGREESMEAIDRIFYEDPTGYVTLRSLYVQNRRGEIAGDLETVDPDAVPDIFGEE
jgi:phospholipid-binding lipoprotein MlaA